MGMTQMWKFRDEALARIELRGFELATTRSAR
jgi:hypothetical protein